MLSRTPLEVLRLDQNEAARRDAISEPPSFAEHHWKDPEATFVDKVDSDQRLQQLAPQPRHDLPTALEKVVWDR